MTVNNLIFTLVYFSLVFSAYRCRAAEI